MTIIIAKGFSTDIHLFKTGQPPATGSTPVGTQAFVQLALAGTTTPGAQLSQMNLTYDTTSAERATSQSDVTATLAVDPSDSKYLRLSLEVQPGASLGEMYCRVAYSTETDKANYSNVLFRVTVHQSLSRFWVGNRRMTLFNSQAAGAYRDERSVVVYAECAEAGTTTSLANLTGNSYVRYVPQVSYPTGTGSAPSLTCTVTGNVRAQVDPAGLTASAGPQPMGTLEVLVGTKAAEILPGATSALLPVYVKAGTDVPRQVLRRFDTNATSGTDPQELLRVLVLTEGFTSQPEVDAWLNFFKDQFLSNPIHKPFNKLVNNIQLWTADMLSHDDKPGINTISPLTQDGYLVPSHPIDVQTLPGYTGPQTIDTSIITIRKLLAAVGLPTASEAPLVTNARTTWNNKYPVSGTTLTDTHQVWSLLPNITQVLYDAWLHQRPKLFLYAKDTIFDIAIGTQQLRRGSATRLTRGDWAIGGGSPKFANFRDRAQKDRYRAILGGLTSPDPLVKGTSWDPLSKEALSAGIVMFLEYDPISAGATVYYTDITVPANPVYKTLACFVSTGQREVYAPLPSPISVTDTDFLDKPPIAGGTAAVNATPIYSVATFVHELGHMLSLGDEYGNSYGNHGPSLPLTTPYPRVDDFPNVVTGQRLQSQGLATLQTVSGSIVGHLKNPYSLLWNWDRMALAGRLLAAPAAVAGKPAVRELRVLAQLNQDWTKEITHKAIVRPRALLAQAIDQTQLHTVVITAATLENTPPTPAYYRLEVTGNVSTIQKGDVLYMPSYYPLKTGQTVPDKMRLVAEQVARELVKTSFRATADIAPGMCGTKPQGIQLPNYKVGAAYVFRAAMLQDLKDRLLPAKINYAPNIIAVYEGGGTYDCGGYRSNGNSKMRNITHPDPVTGLDVYDVHNYVCQYYLINKINPDKLAELDGTYDTQAY